MIENVHIEKASFGDISAIESVFTTEGLIFKPGRMYMKLRDTDCTILLARWNGRIIGLLAVTCYESDPTEVNIDYIQVLADYKKHGIASFLLNNIEQHIQIKRPNQLSASVDSENHAPQKLLESQGFEYDIYTSRYIKKLPCLDEK